MLNENDIIKAIREIPFSDFTGKPSSTEAIKRSLRNLGRDNSYEVCPTEFDAEEREGEWLYDLLWYKHIDGEMSELGLVLESEWDQYWLQIKGDFQKLLIAKSPFKVMVFDGTKVGVPNLWEQMEKSIRFFKAVPSGERYILAGWDDNNDDGFSFKTIVA